MAVEGTKMRAETEAESIAPEEIGLPPGAALPFVFSPPQRLTPLVISFPHIGLEWPDALGPRPQVNLQRNADYEVHRLYPRAAALGAATLGARYTRIVIDLNRASNDVSREIVPDHPAPSPRAHLAEPGRGANRTIRNRGVLWRSAVGNIPLFDTLDFESFERRLREYYWPYHRALATLLERRRRHFGYAVLLDAHSMPGSVGEDLVLGTRLGESADPCLCKRAMNAISEQIQPPGILRFRVDDPYRGGEIIRSLGRPHLGVHALQLEVSRALYMDEHRLDLSPLPICPLPKHPRDPPLESLPISASPPLAALLRCVESLVAVLAQTLPDLAGSR